MVSVPNGRQSHSLTVLADGTAVLFGGYDISELNDIYTMEVSNSDATWTLDTPHPRSQARPSSWHPPVTLHFPTQTCWRAVVKAPRYPCRVSPQAPRDLLSLRPSSTPHTSSSPVANPILPTVPAYVSSSTHFSPSPHVSPNPAPTPHRSSLGQFPRPVPVPTKLAIARPTPHVLLPTLLFGAAGRAPNW